MNQKDVDGDVGIEPGTVSTYGVYTEYSRVNLQILIASAPWIIIMRLTEKRAVLL